MTTANDKKINHSVVWFRNDLRVTDNPALFSACKNSSFVSAVFFIAEQQWKKHHWSERRIYLTLLALKDLFHSLEKIGIGLQLEKINDFNQSPKKLKKLFSTHNIDTLYYNAEYALDEKNRDKEVNNLCEKEKIRCHITHGSQIIPPGSVRTKSATPYKIFTPYKREWIRTLVDFDRMPLAKPKITNPHSNQNNTHLNSVSQGYQALLKLIKKYSCHVSGRDKSDQKKDRNEHHGTEAYAQKQLQKFIQVKIEDYDETRDFPSIDGTSSLSSALTIGLISPRSCLHAARSANEGFLTDYKKGIDTWINEIIWREFYCHLLADFPQISLNKPLKIETDRVPWRHHKKEFDKWCEGKTGFPLVDAAMRQLNQTGWMHNRLRMVTATFLTKYLLIDWRMGEKYFMEQLYDGHFASNNGGWQWSASTGTDAAPYFRILSPVRQAERFDKEAKFIKHFIPELKECSPKIIHQPGHPELLSAGYPKPMVDLKEGKERCLQGFKFALG
ncbi:MAG: cryptochrome/photolyase family protein [Cellvibrionaceae bacterium]